MILLNGSPRELGGRETLAGALRELGLSLEARGVAVAVDGQVVPRAQWPSYELPEGARVEILTAMQGG